MSSYQNKNNHFLFHIQHSVHFFFSPYTHIQTLYTPTTNPLSRFWNKHRTERKQTSKSRRIPDLFNDTGDENPRQTSLVRILDSQLRADRRKQLLRLTAALHSDRRRQILHALLREQHRLFDVALSLPSFHVVEQRGQALLLELFQRSIKEITTFDRLRFPTRTNETFCTPRRTDSSSIRSFRTNASGRTHKSNARSQSFPPFRTPAAAAGRSARISPSRISAACETPRDFGSGSAISPWLPPSIPPKRAAQAKPRAESLR